SGGGSGRGNGGRGGRSGGGGLDKSNGGGLGSKRASLTTEGKVIGSNRDWKLFICFCVAAVLLMGQLVHLQVFAAPDLSEEAKAHRTREVVIPAKRGTIYDLKGSVLATSVDAVTIYANPEEIADPKATANILASVLGGKTQDYYDKLIEDTTFVYILQKADEEQAEKLKQRDRELKEQLTKEARAEDPYAKVPNTALLGIHYYSDTKRVYPHGSIGTQVIGAVDVDDAGIFGIEKMYDNVLCGTDGKLLTEYSVQTEQRPLSGQPIPGSKREEVAPVDGQDIIISLDIELQQYVETELARVGEERATENGNALVLDGATGEIYAVASLPLAERDNMTVEAIEQGATTLKSICSEYEPGSTFKPITATAILEEGAMGIDEEIFVPAFRAYSDYTIKDSHERPDETMSFRTIIAQSSNVGISLVKDRISNESYADYLKQFGIGQPTHVDFPGESAGMLSSWEDWSSIQTANISFGQGLTVSPLQIASFYGAVANDGTKYRPHFLVNQPHSFSHVEIANKSERIMSPETAQTLTDMLSAVVTEGTGQAAAIEGYTVAGKTGTAQKASPEGGYLPDNYIVSFVGFFAESQSELVCITSMDNPTGAEGNAPTGPLFASIMRFAANSYMIEPEGSSAAESTTE
ncbi:MAG: penicillin-binding protein 2, partial [Coriobacteriales bacterium]|nr:penicillin-binding protein 2 [Coriobacteriales bacterium]